MSDLSHTNEADDRVLHGHCGFRLMPSDDLSDAPASATVSTLGQGACLRYTWSHPQDGVQHGALLVGAPDEDGGLEASWFDTWHQQPQLMTLTGRRTAGHIELAGVYFDEWGWQIDVTLADEVTMQMRNVVPESVLQAKDDEGHPQPSGPYVVMDASWR